MSTQLLSPSMLVFYARHLIRESFTAARMQPTEIGQISAVSFIFNCNHQILIGETLQWTDNSVHSPAFSFSLWVPNYLPAGTQHQQPTVTLSHISPISGTDKATVMATHTKKAGRRIWEKRPLVFLLAQWNLFTMSPWNWLSFNHQPSSLKLPCPSKTSGSVDKGFSVSPGGEGEERVKILQAWKCM